MTWIKICGITNLEDARVAVEARADAVGFVFYDKSPRNISAEAAREIAAQLPEEMEKVGVIVNHSPRELINVVHTAGLTAIQHQLVIGSNDSPESQSATGRDCFPARFQTFISFPASLFLSSEDAIRVAAESFARLRTRSADQPVLPDGFFETFFLDSGSSAQPGGTGEPFDWAKAVPIAEGMRKGGLKLVVAGGLTPENVTEAISILHPWGVDVSSGVEARPGKKDPEKVRAFIKAVREADKASSN